MNWQRERHKWFALAVLSGMIGALGTWGLMAVGVGLLIGIPGASPWFFLGMLAFSVASCVAGLWAERRAIFRAFGGREAIRRHRQHIIMPTQAMLAVGGGCAFFAAIEALRVIRDPEYANPSFLAVLVAIAAVLIVGSYRVLLRNFEPPPDANAPPQGGRRGSNH